MPIRIGQQPEHGFDQPLGLLSDCHRRIERFLAAMLAISRPHSGRPLDAGERSTLEQALTYFRTAAPKHTADEEESLFPLLRASGDRGAEVMSSLEALESDHRSAEAGHARVDELVSRWFERSVLSDAEARELVDTLESLQRVYTKHIDIEDRELFPAAARILSPDQLERVGREMAGRRGVAFPGSV